MNRSFNSLLKVHLIKSRSILTNVEKAYVDKLVARNPSLTFTKLSPEVFIDQNQLLFEVSYTVSQYPVT